MCCVYCCVYSVWHADRPEAGGGPEDTAGGLSAGGRSLAVVCVL